MTRRRLVAVVTLVAAALAGCTDSGPTALPPPTVDEISALYEDDLAAMGLVLTDRGGLVDASTYAADPEGTHLSLYVAPVGARSEQAYIEGLVEVTALFASDIFTRWPGLTAFDVCQEAVPAAGEDSAPARSQVTLGRELALSLDWTGITVAGLLEATGGDAASSFAILDPELRARTREAVGLD